MANLIYLRIFGYAVTLILHIGNMLVIHFTMTEDMMKDKDLNRFYTLQKQYITVWNFVAQTIYAGIGLSCDVMTLSNMDKPECDSLKKAKIFRDKMFVRIIWPTSLTIFILFWPFFIYDREMVFPKFIDKVLHPISNHIMHTAIVPIVLLEVACQPRKLPKSHKRNLMQLVSYFAVYLTVIFYTYHKRGIWPYPILHEIQGTIYFPLLFLFVLLLTISQYCTQWYFVRLFWDMPIKQKIK